DQVGEYEVTFTAQNDSGVTDKFTTELTVTGVTLITVTRESGGSFGTLRYSYAADDGFFTASKDAANGVRVAFRTPDNSHSWFLGFAAPNRQVLDVGSYEDTMEYPFQDPAKPGLSVGGEGLGCNTSSGKFEIKEIAYGSDRE